MGYRSYGFFAFPKKYLPELERRVIDADIKWMITEDSGKKTLDLGHFEEVDTFEDRNGFGEMLKLTFSEWKWYSGYDFPQIVETFLYEMDEADHYLNPEEARENTFKTLDITYPLRFINYPAKQIDNVMRVNTYEEPYAFVRVGEEYPDTEVATNMYDIYAQTYISNHPITEQPPVTTIVVDITSNNEQEVVALAEEFNKIYNPKLSALSSQEYFDQIDQTPRKYSPYVKQGEPPKPDMWTKNLYYGWHSDQFASGDGLTSLDILVADMAKWCLEHSEPYAHRDITLAAFTFTEESEPIDHGQKIDVDFELTPHWDMDIYLNNDYYSEI
tara:strand:+ start:299 stop:1285 length:987 start_codon:yes stop_codon:yes gene_type:complete